MKKKKAGRKLKLTNELIDEACKLLKIGNYICTTCDYLGVSEHTWFIWFNKGMDIANSINKNKDITMKLSVNDGLYYQFFQSIKKAQAESIVRSLAIIEKASKTTWQAAAWKLERTNQNLFSIKQQVAITHEAEGLKIEDVHKRIDELIAEEEKKNQKSKIEAGFKDELQ